MNYSEIIECPQCAGRDVPTHCPHCGGEGYISAPVDTTPEPLSGKELRGNEGGLVTTVQESRMECPECRWNGAANTMQVDGKPTACCPQCDYLKGRRVPVVPMLDLKPTGIEAMVCRDIAARQQMGIAKYGRTVAESGDDMLRHAYEEALDLAVYLRAEMGRRG